MRNLPHILGIGLVVIASSGVCLATVRCFEFNPEVGVSGWSVVDERPGTSLLAILDLDQTQVAVLEDSVQLDGISQQADDGVAPKTTRQNLLTAIDRDLQALKATSNSADYRALDRWLPPYLPRINKTLKLFLLPILSLVTGGGVLLVLLWNRSLRNEMNRRHCIEEQLRRLADNTPGVIFRYQKRKDGSDRLLYVSSASEELWNIAPEALIANPELWQQLVRPEDWEQWQTTLNQSAATLAPWKVEWQVNTATDCQSWMQLTAKPHPEPDGSIVWDGLILDVTDRKYQAAERLQIEASLSQSETMVRQVLQAIPDLLLWTRTDGTCVNISAGQELANLLTDQAHVSRNQYDLLPPELAAKRREASQQALDTGKVQVYEQELQVDGVLQYEEVRVVPVESDLLLVIVRNIRDRKRREIERIRNEAYRQQAEQALRDSERRYRQVVEAQTDFILRSRPDTTITFANDALCRALGITAEDIIGKRWQDLANPDDLKEDAFKGLAQLTPEQPRFFAENRDQRAEGQIGWTQWLNQGIFDDQGNLVEIQSVGRDITALKLAEQAARESENRYRLVAENIGDMVCLNDLEGRFTYVSPSSRTVLGYEPEELMGHTPYDFMHPDDRAEIRQRIHQPAAAGQPTSPFTSRMRKKTGEYIWVETLVNTIADDTGRVVQFQTTSRDVTARVEVERQLRHAALHDALTGLPNRTVLMERLGDLIEQSRNNPHQRSALLFLDLDQFKVINDSLGHLTGDQLLVWVADKLSQAVRMTDIVARISGDEFVILLDSLDHSHQAIQIAERVLEELKQPFMMEQREIFITTSIGIVMDFSPYQTAEDLVRDADIAMYRAKARGRASYAVFAPEMRLQVVERMNLGNDLRRAIENQELVLYYQPIIALETLTIEAFEVLLRWQHPRLGLVSPSQFIPIAEETGLIVPIGLWSLETACHQLSIWRRELKDSSRLRISVNLSVRQLQSKDMLTQFRQVLQSTGLSPEALTLEITESMLVQNFDIAHQLLSEVQAQGVHISIDDFGTGYSSLSYLHRLPVDALKIDQTFVSYMGQDTKNQTIAESIIALSNVLGLNAIAEGIETVEQLQWLQSHGCEYGQGYLFSAPVPAETVSTLLQRNILDLISAHHWRLPVTKTGHMSPVGHVTDKGPDHSCE